METLDTFTLLPIQVDPTTKVISTSDTTNEALVAELATLTALHKKMVGLETPNGVPPPPTPVNPKLSQQVAKLRESGNAALKKGSHQDALRMYSLAIDMAMARPAWEPQGLVRSEISVIYANRAQAHMAMAQWADGLIDAEASLEMKRVENQKAWWRKGKCLMEMRRYEEARVAAKRGLEFEFDSDLQKLLNDAERAIERPI